MPLLFVWVTRDVCDLLYHAILLGYTRLLEATVL